MALGTQSQPKSAGLPGVYLGEVGEEVAFRCRACTQLRHMRTTQTDSGESLVTQVGSTRLASMILKTHFHQQTNQRRIVKLSKLTAKLLFTFPLSEAPWRPNCPPVVRFWYNRAGNKHERPPVVVLG